MADVRIPDFDFGAFYYREILESLLDYKRRNIPEISNENPFEPGVQLLRSFALVGHLCNTLLDMAAQEGTIATARLRDSVVNHLALLGYIPAGNIPATAELRAELVTGYPTSTLIVSENSLFGTRRRSDAPPILFEALEEYTISRTDQVTYAYVADVSGYPEVDYTSRGSQANSDANTFFFFPGAGDLLYIAHDTTMTNALEFELETVIDLGDNQAPSDPRAVVWEFYDGNLEDGEPDSVTNMGGTLVFQVNTLLGTTEYRAGPEALVTVSVNKTRVSEELLVQWSATLGNYIETTGFLGETSPSEETNAYTVGTYWHEITGITDGTAATLPVSGENFATGDTVETTFSATLERWPLDAASRVDFSYTSGAVAKTATWRPGNVLSGDAAVGTVVNPSTGAATLVASSAPDDAITVDYTREAQPFQQSGIVSFAVPKNDTEDWQRADPSDVLSGGVEDSDPVFFIRVRVSGEGAGADLGSGIECRRIHWDSGTLYIPISVVQGRTFFEVVGSGTGEETQSYSLQNSPVIEGSVLVSVDGSPWEQVDDFSASTSTSEVYTVRIDSDGVATIEFGDGINGAAPSTGVNNISAEYRVGGAEEGNVGADQIRVNRSGLSRIKNVTNTRAATGWIQQEGASESSLGKLKRDGVASLRVLERAVTTADIKTLATRWTWPATGQKPFSRARAIENGFGPNTIKLILVPIGGLVPSPSAAREAIDAYYNGNDEDGGDEPGVLLINHQLTSEDYTPRTIDVTVSVTGGSKEAIETALRNLLHPEAKRPEDDSYVWEFGGTVTRSKISGAIFQADDDVSNVVMTVPAADVSLSVDELPFAGTILVVMVED